MTDSVAQTAVVTGAGSGIGRACAQMLASRGLDVYCVGRRVDRLKETANLIGSRAIPVPADVSTASGVDAVRGAIGNRTITALVHAAGVDHYDTLIDIDRRVFDELIGINLGGPLFLTQGLLPVLGDGCGIVFVGSVAAECGRAGQAVYGASKAALSGLTVNLAVELAPRIRVNCVYPGFTNTPMFNEGSAELIATMSEEERQRVFTVEGELLLLGIGEPEQIAASILHLALDATYTTGTVLKIDGGYTAR
jgi:3-oxoacyl-[acyl-carrier protein] reductase